ncbi:MAG TPA: hypothetical protein VEG33_14085 [Streptosporangiaceae bacterium]|nr:hypothetical protein [Streptosporangiaceae bacterium]
MEVSWSQAHRAQSPMPNEDTGVLAVPSGTPGPGRDPGRVGGVRTPVTGRPPIPARPG